MRKLIFLLLILFFNCLPEEYQPKYQKESEEYIDKVEILYVKGNVYDIGGTFIEGEVKNKGDKTIKKYSVKIYFLDSTGNPIHEKKETQYVNMKPKYIDKFVFEVYGIPEEWYKKKKLKAEITYVKLEKVKKEEE